MARRKTPSPTVINPSTLGSRSGSEPVVWVGGRAEARARRRRNARIASAAAVLVAITAVGVYLWQAGALGLGDLNPPKSASPITPSVPTTPSAPSTPSNPSTETAAPQAAPPVTINAVGDIAFVSSVQRLMASSGATAPVDGVSAFLRTSNLTIANLETALSERGSAVPGKTFTFRSDPDDAKSALEEAGIDIVSLANNHTRDWGGDALVDTLDTLDRADISWAGAGRNADEAFAPVIVKSNGATVAYLAYSQIGPADFVATDSRSGAAFSLDVGDMKRAVRSAHKRADYVVVSFHWGVEKAYSPSERQVKFGRAAIDAGADVVLAHHPHVLQGVEFYEGGMIAYSLGNFVFSPGSAAGRDTMILSFALSPDGVSEAKARAAYINPSGATRLAEGSTAKRITSLIEETSSERGTAVSTDPEGQTVTLTARP